MGAVQDSWSVGLSGGLGTCGRGVKRAECWVAWGGVGHTWVTVCPEPCGGLAAGRGRRVEEVAERFYLVVLSRPPEPEEEAVVERLFAESRSRREAAEDFLWALINSAEFVHRH